MSYLKLVSNQAKPRSVVETTSLPPVYAGRCYHLDSSYLDHVHTHHGVISGYHISPQCGEIIEASADEQSAIYIWDSDLDLSQLPCDALQSAGGQVHELKNSQLCSNQLVLRDAMLNGPEIAEENGETYLTLSPQFEVDFSTKSYAAQLALIHLVQSKRFITLENGDEVVLLDTRDEHEGVLYMESDEVELPVIFDTVQQQTGLTLPHYFAPKISQPIPSEWNGEPVATVTVLEQYSSYFMQRALQLDVEHIWTPVHAPISWGWSIRAGRRYDGEWAMVRRKLMRPISGHDGLQLPIWSRNSLECALSMEVEV